MTSLGPGHDWVTRRSTGSIECLRCGTRPHWPLAERPCNGRAVQRIKDTDLCRISPEEMLSELGQAFDRGAGDARYECHSPNLLYGRDGRRRTGL